MGKIKYLDRHCKVIQAGMLMRHIDGDIEKVYCNSNGELGFLQSEGTVQNGEFFNLYPLSEFALGEWEIIAEEVVK